MKTQKSIQLLVLCVFLFYTQFIYSQTFNTDINVDTIFNRYDGIIQSDLNELDRLSNYFSNIQSTDIGSDAYLANLSALKGIKSRTLEKIKFQNNQVSKVISTENNSNKTELNSLLDKINSLEQQLKVLKNESNNLTASNIISYFDTYDKIKIQKDSVEKVNKKLSANLVDLDSLRKANNVLNLQLNEYRKPILDWGLSATALYDPIGKYFYEVNNDSTVKERSTDGYGGMLSFVLYFTLNKSKKAFKSNELYGIVNIPFFDISTASGSNFFNKRTSLGFGLGYRWGKTMPVILTAMVNFSTVKRLTENKRNSKDFITDRPNQIIDLDNYTKNTYDEPKIFYNIGIIIPLGTLIQANKASQIKE